MALKLFRQNLGKLKWTLYLVIFALGGSMVLLFVDPPGSPAGTSLSGRQVARVGDFTISGSEYSRVLENSIRNLKQMYGDTINDDMVKRMGVHRRALDELIFDYTVFHEGQRLGIRATRQELAETIVKLPWLSDENGFIGVDRYKDYLSRINYSEGEFEGAVERSIVRRKLRYVLTDGLDATDEEVMREYLNRNQEVRVRYVSFPTSDVDEAQFEESDLEEYFEANRGKYQSGEARRVISVTIEVRPTDIEATREEINQVLEGEASLARFSHILIPFGGDEEAARAQAQSILDSVRGGADFAQQAQQFSKDQATAAKGGDTGFISRGTMDPAFDEVAFKLKAGEIAETLAKSPQGFHIIRMTQAQSTAETGIAEFRARQVLANAKAEDLLKKLEAAIADGRDLKTAAEGLGLEVSDSGFFERTETVPGTQAGPAFSEQVFALEVGQKTEALKQATARYLIAELTEIRSADDLTLEGAREDVLKDYKVEKGRELAQKATEEFRALVMASPDSMEKLAAAKGLKVTTTEFFKKGVNIDETLKFSPELHDQVFTMEKGEVGLPIRVANNFIAFQLVDKSPFDEEKFAQDKTGIREQVADRKRNDFFSYYIQNAFQRLQDRSEIERNQELLDLVAG